MVASPRRCSIRRMNVTTREEAASHANLLPQPVEERSYAPIAIAVSRCGLRRLSPQSEIAHCSGCHRRLGQWQGRVCSPGNWIRQDVGPIAATGKYSNGARDSASEACSGVRRGAGRTYPALPLPDHDASESGSDSDSDSGSENAGSENSEASESTESQRNAEAGGCPVIAQSLS
jgi:hypothetical protein